MEPARRESWPRTALPFAVLLTTAVLILLLPFTQRIGNDPPRATTTELQLRRCLEKVRLAWRHGTDARALPSLGEGEVDGWGRPIRIRVEGVTVHVESTGEDGTWGTGDDRVVTGRLSR